MDDNKLLDIINEAIDTGDYSYIMTILKNPNTLSDTIKKLAISICDELIIEKIEQTSIN